MEHSAILSTCTKLQTVIKTFVLTIIEWPLKTGFTVPVGAYLGPSEVLKMIRFFVKAAHHVPHLAVDKRVLENRVYNFLCSSWRQWKAVYSHGSVLVIYHPHTHDRFLYCHKHNSI